MFGGGLDASFIHAVHMQQDQCVLHAPCMPLGLWLLWARGPPSHTLFFFALTPLSCTTAATKLGGSIALPLPVSKGLAVPMDVAAAGGAAAAASVGLVTEEEFELEMLTASSGSIMAGGIIRRDSSVGSSLGRSSLYTVEEQQAGMEDGMEEGQDEEVEEGAAEGALFEDEFEEVEAGEYGEGQVSAGVTAAAGAAGLDVYGQLLGSLPPSGQALPAGSVITEDGVYGGKAAAGAGAGGGAASQPSLAHLLEQQAHVQGASRGSTKPMETVGTASVAASQSSLSSLGYGKSSRTAATVNAAAPPPTPSLGQGAAALGLPQLASRLQLAVAHTTTSVKAEAKGASPPGSKPGTELPSLSIPNWRWPMSALGSKSPAATTLSTAGSHYSYIPSTAPGTTTSLGPPTVSDRAGAGEDGAAAAAPGEDGDGQVEVGAACTTCMVGALLVCSVAWPALLLSYACPSSSLTFFSC